MRLIVGTRGSPLALTQTNLVLDMLRRARAFRIATPVLTVAVCHLRVHENRLAAGR